MTNSKKGPSIENSISIARPSAEVWDFLTDVSNEAQWVDGTTSACWVSEPPYGVGSTGIRELGDSEAWPFQIMEWEEQRAMSWEVTAGQGEGSHAGFRIAPENGGSRVTLVVGMKEGLIPSLLMPIAKKSALRQLDSNLENLKTVLES